VVYQAIDPLHLSLGMELLAEHKYGEAEIESTAALKGFESGPNVDVNDVSMAHQHVVELFAAKDGAAPRWMMWHRPTLYFKGGFRKVWISWIGHCVQYVRKMGLS
jgi:hypothetical protein